jgi:PAS domain S-box-containing protein
VKAKATHSHEKQEALRASEHRFTLAFQAHPLPMTIHDFPEGRYLEVNEAWLAQTGFTREEAIGKTSAELNTYVDPSVRAKLFQSLSEHGFVRGLEGEMRMKNGEIRRFLLSSQQVVMDGQTRLLSGIQDITEPHRIEAELRQSEAQLRLITHALPVFILHCDTEFRYKFVNKAYAARLGLEPEAVLGKRIRDILGEEVWHAVEDKLDRVLAGELVQYEARIPYPGIGMRFMRSVNVPERDKDGTVRGLIGVLIDISEQKQLEEERAQLLQQSLEQAARLRAADQAKDEFLATLSHELRNPLAPLRNSLALLRMTGNSDATIAPVHQMMERQVNHLIRLVDDLLEVSRISRGTFALRKERVDVATIIRNAVETSEPLIQAAKHGLSVSLPDEALWLDGDAVRLAQILANLLNNAAKYTDEGGQISVRALRQDGAVAISVRDNGAGIAPDTLPRIFEMFNRGARASGHGQGGLGIGLSLARRLAEMHGGTLDAYSEGAGKGSEFTLRLPLAKSQTSDSIVEAPATALLPQRRILIVDDNRDAADSLGMVLQFLGADVRIASDGPEALDAFQTYDPSVVLLDIGMPRMDGYEVARTIRVRFPGCRAAIVAVTGWGQDEDRRRARKAGFDHYLIKPVDIGALQLLLRSLDERAGGEHTHA